MSLETKMVMEEDGFAQRFQVMEDWSKIVSQSNIYRRVHKYTTI